MVCTPGLEPICRQELLDLGCKPKPAGPGTIEFDATHRQIYAANTWLRTAARVVVRVATFRSTDFAHFERKASEIDWSPWLADGVAPNFRVSSNDSKLYHTKGIAQRLHKAVGQPPRGESGGDGEQLFIVRIERNTVTISVDSSGPALHLRPWRTELGEAPLRTTMAAAMLLISEWDPRSGLVDPFCGSGTIGIEAALLAAKMPPGGQREFAFQHWPDFEPGSWASVAGSISQSMSSAEPVGPIHLSDRSEDLVAAARRNAERAEVPELVNVDHHVVSHLKGRTGPGMVITNPPYGKRVGKAELNGLYSRLGAVTRERLPEHGLVILTPDARLAKAADGRAKSIAKFRHGGLPVEIFHRPAAPTDVAEIEPAEIESAHVESAHIDSQPAEVVAEQPGEQSKAKDASSTTG